jgi:hypothetical protein
MKDILEDKMNEMLPNQSITRIIVNTKFKPQIEDGEDFRTEVIREFHNAIHYWIDKQITDNDEFEQDILGILADRGELPKKVKEFMNLGEISIQISEEQPVIINQKDSDEEEIEELPKEQTKLTEVLK